MAHPSLKIVSHGFVLCHVRKRSTRLMYSSWKCKTSSLNLRFTSSSWFTINLLAHSFAFSCINCLLCKLLPVSSLPELAKPRCLALFTTKQDEKMMLRSCMMIYPASISHSIANADYSQVLLMDSHLIHFELMHPHWCLRRCDTNVNTMRPYTHPRPHSPLPSSVYCICNAHDEMHTMKCTRRNAHDGMHTMECTRWNAHNGMQMMEGTW